MPKALVINPNTSPSMTAEIEETAGALFQPPWQVEVVMAPAGPESLESWTDYYLAAVALLPLLSGLDEEVDGIVLACFGDPGLFPLKELAPVPVVGIAEAAMASALLLGDRFGILAGMQRAVALMDSMVRTYGLEARYAGTQSLDMRVLDFEADRARTLGALREAGEALAARGAEVLLLGCAGLTGFAAELQESTGLVVVDPVAAGCVQLQALVTMGATTSHAGLYRQPAAQRMNRLNRLFTAEMRRTIEGIAPPGEGS